MTRKVGNVFLTLSLYMVALCFSACTDSDIVNKVQQIESTIESSANLPMIIEKYDELFEQRDRKLAQLIAKSGDNPEVEMEIVKLEAVTVSEKTQQKIIQLINSSSYTQEKKLSLLQWLYDNSSWEPSIKLSLSSIDPNLNDVLIAFRPGDAIDVNDYLPASLDVQIISWKSDSGKLYSAFQATQVNELFSVTLYPISNIYLEFKDPGSGAVILSRNYGSDSAKIMLPTSSELQALNIKTAFGFRPESQSDANAGSSLQSFFKLGQEISNPKKSSRYYILTSKFDVSDVQIADTGGNGNGTIEPGESGSIVVKLHNSGFYDSSVRVSLSLLNEDDEASLQFIGRASRVTSTVFAGQYAAAGFEDSNPTWPLSIDNLSYDINDSSKAFSFAVSSQASEGHSIDFLITITDALDNKFYHTDSIFIGKNESSLKAGSVMLKEMAGNNDSKINKSETFGLDLSIRNLGVSDALGVYVTATSLNSAVKLLNDRMYFAKVPSLGSSFSSDSSGPRSMLSPGEEGTIVFAVDKDADPSLDAEFLLQIKDRFGNEFSDKVSFDISPTDAMPVITAYKTLDTNGNLNDKINLGETVNLDLVITNEGTSCMNGLKLDAYSQTPYVTMERQGKLASTSLEPGQSTSFTAATGSLESLDETLNPIKSTCMKFKVSRNFVKTGDSALLIPFELVLSDDMGNSWNYDLELECTPVEASIQVKQIYLFDTNNGNRTLESGETFYIDLIISNSSQEAARQVAATLTCDSPYVAIETGRLNIGEVASNEAFAISSAQGQRTTEVLKTPSSYLFKGKVSKSIPESEQVKLTYSFKDASGTSWSSVQTLEVGRYIPALSIADTIFLSNEAYYDLYNFSSFRMGLNLVNQGLERLNGITLQIIPDPEAVIGEPQSIALGNFDREQMRFTGYTEQVYKIKPTVTIGSVVEFTYRFTDALGSSWDKKVAYVLNSSAPSLSIDKLYINGLKSQYFLLSNSIEKGSTKMQIIAANRGTEDSANSVLKLTSDNPKVTVPSLLNFGPIGSNMLKPGTVEQPSNVLGFSVAQIDSTLNNPLYSGFDVLVDKDLPAGTYFTIKADFYILGTLSSSFTIPFTVI